MDCSEKVTRRGKLSAGSVFPDPGSVFPDLSIEGPSAAHVKASRDRCESLYDLDPHSRLLYNRYSQSELVPRMEKVEEPLARAQPLITNIRTVVKNADYCMLIADDECAAIAEYHDTDLARYLKKQGIAAGTLWDEQCVGTNGIGTSTADTAPVTVNGEQHYHSKFFQFICSAAPLIDQFGHRYGALNVTGPATKSATEVVKLSQFVRRAVANLHSYVFRDYFKDHRLVVIADERFNSTDSMSKVFAIDDAANIIGVTNDLLASLEVDSREGLIGKPLSKFIGLDVDKLMSSDERLHELEHGKLDGRYALSVPPTKPRTTNTSTSRVSAVSKCQATEKSTSSIESNREEEPLDLDALAGSDSRMIKHVELCRRMFRNTQPFNAIPLLLQGETGTGKDTFAKAVHLGSNRRDKPLVELNCATIPESLIDSELFGYAPGTFTGGLKDGKTGYIEAAHEGTLFLDEIGDMPLDSQTRLLRVLSERRVQPLGASQSVDVDFALICASNKNLIDLVEEGLFREDLYYRVCGAKVTLSALRERSDFRVIAKRHLRRLDSENKVTISDALWKRLEDFDWPGNIRQLQNVLQYIVFSCDEGVATENDLPEDLLHEKSVRAIKHSHIAINSAEKNHIPTQAQAAVDAVACVYSEPMMSKRDQLLRALHDSRWCVAKAARSVGVSRATVHRQMKKFGIVRPDHQSHNLQRSE